ncbi:MAG: hemolysin family protein [Clostridiales bacterium]|nr:hemolysin family protein [Clostridiales bacterium]
MSSHLMATVAIVLLIAASAYFSAMETAFTSFNRIRIKNMASEGSKKAKAVLNLADNFDKLLSTILIGNNIVNIAAASIATLLFVDLFGSKAGAPLSALTVTVTVLVFGEISPKSIAKEVPEKVCLFSAPIIKLFLFVLTPVNFLFAAWKRFLTKILALDAGSPITEEELLTIVEEAQTVGSINTEQSELIQNAIEFNELEAWDVLTPRVDVAAIDISDSKAEVARVFAETGFSRLPVYEETIDKIVGVLNQKDFSNFIVNSGKEISEFVKPVVFMAGSVKIAALLKRMQKAKTHIAIIVDEYGGTEGIVTMEDIIEELVGEIYDEHETEASQEFLQLQDGSYKVLCSANVDKMFDYFGIKQELAEVTTVNGWVVVELGKLPEAGDTFKYEGLSVAVTRADGKKALEIKIVRSENQSEPRREQ